MSTYKQIFHAFFLKKANLIGTIVLNYLILIVAIIFLFFFIFVGSLSHFESLVNQSICHMKLTTLEVDPRLNHETCFR